MFPKHLINGLADVDALVSYIPADCAGLGQISYELIMLELELMKGFKRGDSGIRSTAFV